MSESYVVRLRGDARARGEVVGEVEEVESRRTARVRDAAELLAFILGQDRSDAAPASPAPGGAT